VAKATPWPGICSPSPTRYPPVLPPEAPARRVRLALLSRAQHDVQHPRGRLHAAQSQRAQRSLVLHSVTVRVVVLFHLRGARATPGGGASPAVPSTISPSVFTDRRGIATTARRRSRCVVPPLGQRSPDALKELLEAHKAGIGCSSPHLRFPDGSIPTMIAYALFALHERSHAVRTCVASQSLPPSSSPPTHFTSGTNTT
jgi:hypothetical protein